jgi:hypothetical protein
VRINTTSFAVPFLNMIITKLKVEKLSMMTVSVVNAGMP